MGGDGLFELRRPTLALPEDSKRDAQPCSGALAHSSGPRSRGVSSTNLLNCRWPQAEHGCRRIRLLADRVRLPLFEVAYPLVLVGAVRRENRSRVGKMLGGLGVTQSGEGDFAASG